MLSYGICLAHVRSATEQKEALLHIFHANGLYGAALGALGALRLDGVAAC